MNSPISIWFCRWQRKAMLLISLLLLMPLAWSDVQYTYDADGRVIQVVNTDGSTVQYSYDGAGNLTGMLNNMTTLSLVNFSPLSGAAGTTVTLSGTAFDTTAANNIVKFNGTTATVTSASANTLVVTVPSGATTGTISVTNSLGTVTTATSFTVTPALSFDFTPLTGGSPGTSVTITGGGFDASGDSVQINGQYAAVTSETTTQIIVTVPAQASTGPISVTTQNGSAVSSMDFYIPLPVAGGGTIAHSSISSVSPITTAGSPTSISSLPTGQYTVFLINGDPDNLYSLQFSSLTSGATLSYSLYAPDNTKVKSSSSLCSSPPVVITCRPITSTNLSLHLPLLSKPGYYTLAISTDTTGSSFSATLEKDTFISTDGTALDGSITVANQSERYVFPGYIDQYMGFGINNFSGMSQANIYLYDPTGASMISGAQDAQCYYSTGGGYSGVCAVDVPERPYNLGYPGLHLSGLYGVIVDPVPASGSTCSSSTPCTFSAYLTQDVTGTLTENSWSSLATTIPGQNLRYTFTGTASQVLSMDLSNYTNGLSSQSIAVTVYDPTKNPLNFTYSDQYPFLIGYERGKNIVGGTDSLGSLAASGTYTVFIEVYGKHAGTFSLSMLLDTGYTYIDPGYYAGDPDDYTSNIPVNPLSPYNIPADGAPALGSITSAGSNYLYTFSGTAGQDVGLALSILSMPGSATTTHMVTYSPTGTSINSTDCVLSTGTGCTADLTSLPATGIYTVVITPGSGAVCGASPDNCSFTLAAASQAISFGAQATQTYSSGGTFSLSPLAVASSGSAATYASTTTSVCTISGTTVTMLAMGTCTITANESSNPSYPVLAQNITITTATQSITFGSQPAETYSPGGSFALSPTATASSGLDVAYSSLTTSVCTIIGTQVTMVSQGTCTIAADQNGNSSYPPAAEVTQGIAIGVSSQTITFGTQSSQTYSPGGTFSLSPVATASSGLPVSYSSTTTSVCTISGTTVSMVAAGTCTIAADQAGNSNYTAATEMTQGITIGKASQEISSGAQAAQTYSPGGTFSLSPLAVASSGLSVSYSSTTTSVCTVSGTTVTMLSTGTCTIAADQSGNADYNAATEVTQNITINDASQSITFGPQWPVAYSSGGTFSLSPVATASSGLSVTYSSTTTGVCTVSGTTVTMVSTGTCTIAANQSGNADYNAATEVTQNIVINNGNVVTNVPLDGTVETGSITVNGKNLLYSFSGTQGQNLGMGMSIQNLSGSGTYVNFAIYSPDGTQLQTSSCVTATSAGCSANLMDIPQTGNYDIIITTVSGTSCGTSPNCNFSMSISTDATGTLTVGAAATTYTSSIMGQVALYTFNITSSGNTTLHLTNRTFTGTTEVKVFGPDSTTTQAGSTLDLATSSGSISLSSLATGAYTIVVNPLNNSTGQIKLQVTQP